MDHNELKNKYKSCIKCAKCQNGLKVFGTGNLKAKIAIVGEGPGKDEINELTPFVGASGKLLNEILLGVGLKREDLFITNTILCRTDNYNRTPTREEMLNCRDRLFEELLIVNPRYTILTGSAALKTVMGDSYGVMKDHGKWFTLLTPPCLFYYSIYHPSWILHSTTEAEGRAKKMTMWNDIKAFIHDVRALDAGFYNKQGDIK